MNLAKERKKTKPSAMPKAEHDPRLDNIKMVCCIRSTKAEFAELYMHYYLTDFIWKNEPQL